MKINIKTDIRYAFFYFFVVVCLGVFLRLAYVLPMPFAFDYRNLLHAHSHTAFLGWIYVLLTGLICREFIPIKNEKTYRILFYLTQFSVLGMLFSFSFQGYGLYSIAFSSIFIFITYFFAYFFFKHSKKELFSSNYSNKTYNISFYFVKMGVLYLIISSLGIWAIPISIIQFGKNSDFYKASIAFFLHFQYNGWILSALTGLFIRQFQWNLPHKSLFNKLLYGFQISVIGTLPISLLGIFDLTIFYVIGGFCSLIWLCIILIISVLYFKSATKKSSLATLFLLFFILKIIMMIFGVIMGKKGFIFNNNDLIISYLHLNFLGIINIGLLFLLQSNRLFGPNKWLVTIYLSAFLVTELLIAYKGFSFWTEWTLFENYFQYLAWASALFLFPALGWWLKTTKSEEK